MALPDVCQQCGKLAFSGQIVTISGKEYEELLQYRRVLDARAALHAVGSRRRPRSRLSRDPEVASFIALCAETMTVKDAYTAATIRFGLERTPSKSTIYRFLYGVRG